MEGSSSPGRGGLSRSSDLPLMSRFSNLTGGDFGLKPPGGGPVRAKPAGGSFGVTTPLLDGTGGGLGVAETLLNAGGGALTGGGLGAPVVVALLMSAHGSY